MRDDKKILAARARKDSTVKYLLDNIETVTDSEIDAAPIKPGDRKLLKRARPRLERERANLRLEATAAQMASAMPTHDGPEELFDLYIYQGEPTTYNGLEVDTGTVISYTDEWIRFDHYRIKRTEPIDHLLSRSEFQCRRNITRANNFIQDQIQRRHTGDLSEPVIPEGRMFGARSFW